MFSCKEQLQNPNPSLYDEDLWGVAKGYCTYLRTSEAVFVTSFAGMISTISSMSIIYIIFISPSRLSSIYHRIMLGLSISDIILNGAISLATLPMPPPGDYWTDINNIQGTRMGNAQTCTAQGFSILFGAYSKECYFIGLCIYYLCAIGFKMTTKKIKKYVEPLIHLLSISISLLLALPPVFQGNYNTSFNQPFCMPAPKPWFCDNDDNNGVECVRGGEINYGCYYELYNLIVARVTFVIFGLLCWLVYDSERQVVSLMNQYSTVRQVRGDGSSGGRTNHQEGRSAISFNWTRSLNKNGIGFFRLPIAGTTVLQLRNGEEMSMEDALKVQQYNDTKIIALQVILYVLLYFLSPISYTILMKRQISGAHPSQMPFDSLLLSLSLLDGGFYLFMFMFHKVRNLKRCDNNLHTWKAIRQIFRNGGADDTFVMTRMHIVMHYHDSRSSTSIDYSGDDDSDDSTTEKYGENRDSSSTSAPSLSFSFLRPAVHEESIPFCDSSNNNDIISYGGASCNIGSSAMASRSLGPLSYYDFDNEPNNDDISNLLSYASQDHDREEEDTLSPQSSTS